MDSDISKLIGVTEQQIGLLRAIDHASAAGKSRPKDIEMAYTAFIGKTIQITNMFAQLRALQQMGFVVKVGTEYGIKKEQIQHSINKKIAELAEEIKYCDVFSKEIDKLFENTLDKLAVRFFSHHELYAERINELKIAHTFCRTSHLPSILQAEPWQKMYGTTEYANTIIRLCKAGKLNVYYVLSLRPEKTFLRIFSKLKNKERAYELTAACYDRLIELLAIQNFHFRYSAEGAETFSVVLGDSFGTLQLPVRESLIKHKGGIVIENKANAEFYKKMFDDIYNSAQPLTAKLIKEIAKKNLLHLKRHMNELTKEIEEKQISMRPDML